MKENTHLSRAIDAAGRFHAAYDAYVKELLADKQILARILKYTVDEFADMEIADILSCIGEEVEVAQTPLEAGLSNLGRVQERRTEDNVPNESAITYDIRFNAYFKDRQIKFLVNVEAQKSSEPSKLGYHLENRIVFYLARMISAQKQTEFFHSDYDSLKPVRSIWICMDNSEDGGSIEEIGLTRTVRYGRPKNYEALTLEKGIIVNIRLNQNKRKKSQNELIAMLEVLLSDRDEQEKKQCLTADYGMVMTEELEGRLEHMCNLSEWHWEMAMEKGRQEGLEKGIETLISSYLDDGAEENFIIGKLVKKYQLSEDEAKQYFERFALQVN